MMPLGRWFRGRKLHLIIGILTVFCDQFIFLGNNGNIFHENYDDWVEVGVVLIHLASCQRVTLIV